MAEAIDPLRGGAEPAALQSSAFLKGASLNMGFGTLGATCTAAEQAPINLGLTQIVTANLTPRASASRWIASLA